MGGHSCCMVDCHACEKRNKGVTFHKLRPASDDKTTQEWRNRLISVISRSDNSFNPDKAYICSRHFDDDCFIPHVLAFVEVTKFLLSNGVKYILSQVFNQDPLEEHFGRHRGMGRRSDNPNLWTFGYQEQKLRLQRSLALQMRPKGNVRGEKRKIVITSSPMKKVKR